ncbi:peptidylprolyl isomerase domain and WD repeat-containing protein 1 [Reticulomyxa filosa]|uniref:Peptidylprolyl isomerase domain and WD repeat-containing protein 1 n=1 Tax=Reticulomyxa filosa TaxID=46433 RepID=X6MMT3_RETFI|nr:peptidylprolyl isomerase domain and WD repeat-containing protein 1 [Reticulomyxa filosa]|eukprot:ETO14752.1 peptidylprolyl isomerase domain and WD repeat-containing protein 1 [Reticulomyxa filosa]
MSESSGDSDSDGDIGPAPPPSLVKTENETSNNVEVSEQTENGSKSEEAAETSTADEKAVSSGENKAVKRNKSEMESSDIEIANSQDKAAKTKKENDNENNSAKVGDPDEMEASKRGERTMTKMERVGMSRLPDKEWYEWSYMHRYQITHIKFAPFTDFLITASKEGVVKFWKKTGDNIEFAKMFAAHMTRINDIAVSSDGILLATVAQDCECAVFDIPSFDMILRLKLDFTPRLCTWIHTTKDPTNILAMYVQCTSFPIKSILFSLDS